MAYKKKTFTEERPALRVPPYSAEAEQAVLGAILLDAPRAMEITLLDDSAYTHEFELADDQLHFYGTSYVEPDAQDGWRRMLAIFDRTLKA